MGTLYLVRHGQASFGADDYDRLSDLGRRQSVRLGQYLRERFGAGLRFDAVLTGTLRRQIGTWHGIAEGGGFDAPPSRAGPPPEASAHPGGDADTAGRSVGAHILWPGLNEYDSHAVIAAIHPDSLPRPGTPELYRHHFRLLREGLAAWMDGRVQPVGMPSYADFRAGVVGALDHVRKNCQGNVLMVSSGGPIATAVAHVLHAPAATSIELNLRIRNTALTELAFSPTRHQLITYNTLPHLDAPPYRDWVTHA
ncbi:histidine phosphatase family protein [Ottowia sp.]|uniref:histidine phosphatase family protein n=1 Tax=Ottowia sp. TaxID=1898956 RepID=UPI002C0ED5FA|nr:histidine phosphatase family protein [Ottowia sp.]HOB65638.1 histidine phosphatase family protein [Ottowia sp.]HPZ56379.1 histidine phosphatase family protein [Ottowia sp.]HQD46916.1 histidine phosphatase family protein [Ottowia sp.]